ncbi:alpha-methylacyl-CoA racemase [Aureococcus anophagefferens]|nr:alpha-methylacyl-CoA racemase [Aureococcus anophagefferens]
MGDSWEDFDDDDVKLPGAAVAPAAWDDEEEEDEIETVAAPQQSSAKAAAARPGEPAEVDPNMVSIKLEDLKDHLKLVTTLGERFKECKSKDNHVFMFVKEFLKVNDAKFTSADLADLIILLTNNKKAKDLLIEKPTESNKTKKSKKKSKKEQLEQNKKHADLFGEAEAGEYDNYEDQYDDFF